MVKSMTVDGTSSHIDSQIVPPKQQRGLPGVHRSLPKSINAMKGRIGGLGAHQVKHISL